MENSLSKRAISQLSKIVRFRLNNAKFDKVKISDFKLEYRNQIVSLQRIAAQICRHYGLSDYTPVVTLEVLRGAAGRINLNKDKEVFIDLDKRKYFDIWEYVATIAHEVAHKYLFVNDIYYPGQKNEFVTDATAVYAGFGDIMFVAAFKETTETKDVDWHHDEVGRYRPHKRVTTTRTKTLGYLLPWQIAFLQNCFCNRYIELRIFKRYFYIMKPWSWVASLLERKPKRE